MVSVKAVNTIKMLELERDMSFIKQEMDLTSRSIDKIFDGEPNKKFIKNNTGELPQGYTNILDYSIESDIDLKQNLTLGTYNSRAIYFNPFAMDYYVKEFKYQSR